MAEYNLGTAKGRVVIDYDGAGVEQAKAGIDSIDKKAGATDAQLNKVATSMAVVGGAIAAGLGVAVKSAADFEQSLSGIRAVSGATETDMEKVRAKALQLGADTMFSAGESAVAIEELVKAGLSLSDVMGGAADATVSLAAAGEISLPEAATIASNAMNQFGLSAGDMVNVADKIAGAANTSAIDVGQFGQSLTQVGAVANLAGISFDDTAAAIGLLGNAGIVGSDAGTSLKTMFMNLQPATEKQADMFRKLGIITEDGTNKFYDANGSLKSLAEVSGILQDSTKNLTDAEKQMALEVMFGSDAIRAAAVLTDEGAAGFNNFATEMGKLSAADVAKTRMDNFAGSLEQMKGSLETLAITLGTILLPPLRALVDGVTQLLNWFMQLSPQTQQIIVAFLATIAALLLVGAAIIKTVMFVKELKAALMAMKALSALAPLMKFIFGPWGLAILAIIALAYLIYKNWDTIKALLIQVWEAIKSAFSTAWDAISSFFSATMDKIKSIAETVWNAISGFFSTIFNAIKIVFMTVFDAIKAYVTTVFGIYKTIIETALNAIKAVWEAIWGVFGPLLTAVFNLIKAIIELFWVIVKGMFLLALDGLKLIVGTAFDAIKKIVETVLGAIKAVIETVWNAIKPYVQGAVNAVKGFIEAGFNAAKAIVEGVMGAIRGVIESIWGAIKGIVDAAVGKVKGFIEGLSAIVAVVSGIFGRVRDAVSEKIGAVVDLAKGLGSRIASAVGNLGRLLYNKGKDIIQGLIDGITSMITKVTGAIKKVTSAVSAFLPGSPVKEGPLRVLNRGYAGGEIMRMLANGVEKEMSTLEGVMRNLSVDPVLASAASIPIAATPTAPSQVPVPRGGDVDLSALLASVEGLREEVRRQTDRNQMITRTELETV